MSVKYANLTLAVGLLFLFAITLSWASGPELSEDYQIGPGDLLEVSVYEQQDLSKTVRVTSDGFISFPLIERVSVKGLTASAIEKKIEGLLAKGFLVNPQVNVVVKEYKSKRVLMLGQVFQPGVLELSKPITLLEALSRVGGLRPDANKTAIISRSANHDQKGGDSKKIININLNRILDDGETVLNIEVLDGDVVHIPKANSVYVFGEVKKPGSYVLEKEMTILQAITMAGGFTEIAAPSRTKIIRMVDGKEKVLDIDVTDITKRGDKKRDVQLEPNDIIVVPESFF